MATTDVEFTFIGTPPTEEEVESNLFTIMLDVSGVEEAFQPLVIMMMQLVQQASRDRGARYTFLVK